MVRLSRAAVLITHRGGASHDQEHGWYSGSINMTNLWTPDRRRPTTNPIQQENITMDAERQRLINDAVRILGDINQYFMDVAYWNDHTRIRLYPHEPPIDPDPSGHMAHMQRELEAMLKLDADLGHFPTVMLPAPATFEADLRQLLNRHNQERTGGDTPDFILAQYLVACLATLGKAVSAREAWYGRDASAIAHAAGEAPLNPAPCSPAAPPCPGETL